MENTQIHLDQVQPGLNLRLNTFFHAVLFVLGMSQQSVFQAMLLSSGYVLGLGLPFLVIGLGMGQAVRVIIINNDVTNQLKTVAKFS